MRVMGTRLPGTTPDLAAPGLPLRGGLRDPRCRDEPAIVEAINQEVNLWRNAWGDPTLAAAALRSAVRDESFLMLEAWRKGTGRSESSTPVAALSVWPGLRLIQAGDADWAVQGKLIARLSTAGSHLATAQSRACSGNSRGARDRRSLEVSRPDARRPSRRYR